VKLICWNMAAAYGYDRERHERAWRWLNEQDADVALVQEVVPHEEHLSNWGSVIFKGKYKKHGCAVLVREGGYRAWTPSADQPWLQRIGGAVAVAEPVDSTLPWLVSIHSDAMGIYEIGRKYHPWYDAMPSTDGIPRCSETEIWEVEAAAHELRPILSGSPFLCGGDLNSALLFDSPRSQENARLFSNLADQGYVDTRPRHWADEVQTFFREGRRPFQLDHVFADAKTESLVTSWRVLREPVESHDASDHAPIEIVIGHERDIQIG